MKKTIITIVITVATTSLLWFVGIKAFNHDSKESVELIAEEQQNKPKVNKKDIAEYPHKIIGRWTPVEDAEYDIEFSKYGSMKWHVDIFSSIAETAPAEDRDIARSIMGAYEDMLKVEFPYYVDGYELVFNKPDEEEPISARIKIYTKDDVDYLEIYDVTKLSGKYRKVAMK